MSTHLVESPDGRAWRVGVPLLPWRPRWRGPRPWTALAGGGEPPAEHATDDTAKGRRRPYEVGDLTGEAVGQGIVELPLQLDAETIGEGLAPILLALLAGVAPIGSAAA